jgi:NNP family nitrate/nitrite transporter-like MFS transporter
MGGGVTQIIMPLLVAGFTEGGGCPSFTAWRWSFFIPGVIFLIMGGISLVFGEVC